MTRDLDAGRFAEFVAALHPTVDGRGRAPFPWQQRLADQVVADGTWPDLLALPTAAGKTATVEIALFALACGAPVPRRVVFVVDRRIVVSQAARVAENLATALAVEDRGVLGDVARALRALAPDPAGAELRDRPVVQWAELRGGIARDEAWATRPDMPAVVVSTVDQVGSRLLFRGYGVSRGMAPVHAGLLGVDCLFLLDEVHLSEPFAQTLRAVGDRFRPTFGDARPPGWQVVELSATARRAAESRIFELDRHDTDPDLSPVIARRVGAAKPAVLELVPSRSADAAQRTALVARAVTHVRALAQRPGVSAVGVVVNRVETAQRVAAALQQGPAGSEQPGVPFDVCLLTGRMRGLDRDAALAAFGPRLLLGRDRSARRPVALVATQAVEAGADFDLDVLVTECASLDALQQRFGRVRRDGLPAEPAATSVVLAAAPAVVPAAEDPVYGTALRATWEHLRAAADLTGGHLDLGPGGFDTLRARLDDDAEVDRQLGDAPVLFPRHLDLWSQTAPHPSVDPDPSLWLHGLATPRPEVTVVWRRDVPDLRPASTDPTVSGLAAWLVDVVGVVPPAAGESVSLPLRRVADWLEDLASPPGDARRARAGELHVTSDTEAPEIGLEPDPGPRAIAPVLRWLPTDSELIRNRSALRPGDVLVVPASYGGLSQGTFDPTARVEADDRSGPVTDLATQAAGSQRRQAVLRLRSDLLPASIRRAVPPPAPDPDGDTGEDVQRAADWLEEVRRSMDPEDTGSGAVVGSLLRDLRGPRPEKVVRRIPGLTDDDSGHLVLVGRRMLPRSAAPGADTIDEDTPELAGVEVELHEHLGDVARWAEVLARSCRLPEGIAGDVVLAARWHDIGKLDPRFQAMLSGGVPDPAGTLRAKSAEAPSLLRRRELAASARYPAGTRHEMTGVSLIDGRPDVLDAATDPDLVLHLIASHHGWARPFAPVVRRKTGGTFEARCGGRTWSGPLGDDLAGIGSGVAERFWRCTRRYGWYGLAYLEAVLRLADHRASQAEQTRTEGAGS